MKTGMDNLDVVRMYYRKVRFYLDENHDFTIEMAPLKYARVKVNNFRVHIQNSEFYNSNQTCLSNRFKLFG
jgi:hypothetical protein